MVGLDQNFANFAQFLTLQGKDFNTAMDMFANLLNNNRGGMSTLPEAERAVLQEVGRVLFTNFGKTLGLSDQGSMFNQIHQGVLAGGPIRGIGTLPGQAAIGTAFGPGALSMSAASQITNIVDNMGRAGSGVNTQGLSSGALSSLAGAIIKKRGGIKTGDFISTNTGNTAASFKDTLEKLKKNGINANSEEYQQLARDQLLVKHMENMSEKWGVTKAGKEYGGLMETIAFREKQLAEKGEELKKTNPELYKQKVDELAKAQNRRDELAKRREEYVKEKTVGARLKGEGEVKGDFIVGEADWARGRMARKGGMRPLVATDSLKTDLEDSVEALAGNMKELSEIFGTDNFSELNAIANDLRMGSLDDKRDIESVASRIAQAKAQAALTGRSLQEVFQEQADIVTGLSTVYGGKNKVAGSAIVHSQRLHTQNVKNNEVGGDVDDETNQGRNAAMLANFNEHFKGVMVAKRVLADNQNLNPQVRKEMQTLLDQIHDPKVSYEEKLVIASKLMSLSREHDVNAHDEEWVKNAVSQYSGDEFNRTQKDISRTNNAAMATEISDTQLNAAGVSRSGAVNFMNNITDVFGGNFAESTELFNILDTGNEKDIQTWMADYEQKMRNGGASEEDIAKFRSIAKMYSKSSAAGREALKSFGKRAQNGKSASVTTSFASEGAEAMIQGEQYMSEMRETGQDVASPESIAKKILYGKQTTDNEKLFNAANKQGGVKDGHITDEWLNRQKDKGIINFGADERNADGTMKDQERAKALANDPAVQNLLGTKDAEETLRVLNDERLLGMRLKKAEGSGKGKGMMLDGKLVFATKDRLMRERAAAQSAKGSNEQLFLGEVLDTDMLSSNPSDIKTDSKGRITQISYAGRDEPITGTQNVAKFIAEEAAKDPERMEALKKAAEQGNVTAKAALAQAEGTATESAYILDDAPGKTFQNGGYTTVNDEPVKLDELEWDKVQKNPKSTKAQKLSSIFGSKGAFEAWKIHNEMVKSVITRDQGKYDKWREELGLEDNASVRSQYAKEHATEKDKAKENRLRKILAKSDEELLNEGYVDENGKFTEKMKDFNMDKDVKLQDVSKLRSQIQKENMSSDPTDLIQTIVQLLQKVAGTVIGNHLNVSMKK